MSKKDWVFVAVAIIFCVVATVYQFSVVATVYQFSREEAETRGALTSADSVIIMKALGTTDVIISFRSEKDNERSYVLAVPDHILLALCSGHDKALLCQIYQPLAQAHAE